MPGTAALQEWMQAAILAGEGDARTRDEIRDGNRLTAEARLAIYASGYRQRLLECLEAEYPILAALVGPTAFALFARGYIAAHPSQSYTLYDFGAGFADYLEAARPEGDGTPQTVEAIPAALARIERAKAEMLRARGIEQAQAPAAGGGLDPVLAAMLGLVGAHALPDSVRLLALPFDFTATLAAAEQGEAPVLPAFTPSLVAVARVHYRLAVHAIEAWQYDWLAGLPAPSADPRIAGWLPFAVGQGLAVPLG
ncbi:MAG: DNA-binding domain-containing protein [Pseudomonadota bacterium]